MRRGTLQVIFRKRQVNSLFDVRKKISSARRPKIPKKMSVYVTWSPPGFFSLLAVVWLGHRSTALKKYSSHHSSAIKNQNVVEWIIWTSYSDPNKLIRDVLQDIQICVGQYDQTCAEPEIRFRLDTHGYVVRNEADTTWSLRQGFLTWGSWTP